MTALRTLLGKLPLVRFPIILALFVIMLPVSYLGLAGIADGINNRLYFSARLEEASRLELEATTFFSKAEAFAEGEARRTQKEVGLALDLFWSRVDVLSTKSYRRFQEDEALDEALITELLSAMPALEQAAATLRQGKPESYRDVGAFARRYRERIIAFSDDANKARRKRMNKAVETHLKSVTTLKRIQIAYVVLGVGAVIYVLTELYLTRRLNQRLGRSIAENRQLLFTDHLTGIGNRACFENLLKELDAVPQADFSVIYFDLDGFKQVNDTLGHAMGDTLLKHVASILVATHKDQAAASFRFGGDEFAVLLVGGPEEASSYAERAVNRIARPAVLAKNIVQVSASAGFSHMRDLSAGEATDALMRNADLALYAAKSAGRNCVRPFAPPMLVGHERKVRLEKALSEAVRRGAVDVVFRPILDLRTFALRAVEVRPAWTDKTYGVIAPAEIRAIAEDGNLALELSAGILGKAFRALGPRVLQRIPTLYLDIPENLLSQPTFAGHLCRLLDEFSIERGRLQLELRRAAKPDYGETYLASIRRLRDAGVAFATKDIGRAIDRRNRLANLDFGTLKLDRALVEEVSRSERSRGVVAGLAVLARQMSAAIVAQGIDSTDDLKRLRQMNIALGEGRALSPVLSPPELVKRLDEGFGAFDAVTREKGAAQRRATLRLM